MRPVRNLLFMASGKASLFESVKNIPNTQWTMIFDRPCPGLNICETKWKIPYFLIPRQKWKDFSKMSKIEIFDFFLNLKIDLKKIDLIVLGGFLGLLPSSFLQTAGPVINVHPSLLPDYGGAGMYGMNVHKAVIENKSTFSGCSVHFVSEILDGGEVIAQAKCNVLKTETVDSLSEKIFLLEKDVLPRVIHSYLELTPASSRPSTC